ncbi:MAG TPA: lipid-A-disaccharide synthase [Candidatus Eisenbacteria bacterium]|nr:lipid-A-disaccharide synthase [Candidatus Eisenbacteria bacterium]
MTSAERSADRAAIMLSAGEASGDLHGGTLCRALRDLAPGLHLTGMGGAHMAAAGMEVIVDPTGEATVGTSEAVGRIPALYRAYRAMGSRLLADRPRALVLIDFPEFNLRLARRARRAGVPVVYFIPPQLWAWRAGRVRQMARQVKRVLAVFPFEPPLYERARVPVTFVGHPLLDVLPLDLTRDEARRRLGADPGHALIGLLPGSRPGEIDRLLPPMLDAARRLAAADARRRFTLGLAPTVAHERVTALITAAGPGIPPIEVVSGRTYEVMAAADTLLIASGTASLEAALLGAPMVICYRVSRLTELVARTLTHVRWIGLPNLVAGREIVPELIQGEATGARLAREAARLLDDPVAATAQRAAFKDLRARLGEPGVGRRAARAVLDSARTG